VAAANVEFLAAGQHQIETFTFNVLDGRGGSVSRTVSVDITGTNDAPIVAGTDVTGTMIEDDADPALNASGMLTFTDVDLIDTHNVTVTKNSGTVGGTLSAIVTDNGDGTGTGTVDWTYEVANADVQYLAEDETTSESFTIQVADGHGGFDTEVITLTITGMDDAPVITSDGGGDTAAVSVAENTMAVTTVTATDPDAGDTRIFTIVDDVAFPNNADAESFSIDPATGVLTFFDAPDFENPTDVGGDNVYQVVVQVSDDHGVTDMQSIAVTVTGNRPPEASNDYVITKFFNGQPVKIPEWALLANDSDPDGDLIDVDNVIATSGVALHHAEPGTDGYVTITRGSAEGSSFTYQAIDVWGAASSVLPEPTTVNVTRDIDGNFDLNGTDQPPINNIPQIEILVVGVNFGTTRVFGIGGNDILVSWDGNDMLSGGGGNDTIDGGAGIDLLDFSEVSTGFSFTLGAGGSGSATVNGTDTYWNMEGVIGGSGDNTLTGNAGNNVIRGGAGNDTIDGTAGVDLLDFSDATSGLTGESAFTLVQSALPTSFSAPGLGTDSYSNMEGVIGSAFADTLTGTGLADVLSGGGGNDTLTGGTGSDLFDYNDALSDADADTTGDVIIGFQTGSDKLDLHDLLASLEIPGGTGNAFIDGYLRFTPAGGDTLVQVSAYGDPWSFETTLATLIDVAASSLNTGDFILIP
jgi:VCBS repeat-containing protein